MALVDEAKYNANNGLALRFGREEGVLLKSRKRTENRDIVTRIYPYGNGWLNIAKVNNGKEYIENFNYTDEVLVGILQNNDIYNQDTLLAWAKKQLTNLSKPRNTYDVDLLDMREQDDPQGVGPELGVMCTIFDSNQPEGNAVLRVVEIDRDVFNHTDCKIVVGDVALKWPALMKDLVTAKEVTNNTVSSTQQVPGAIVRGETPALTQSNIKWTGVTNTINGNVSRVQQQADYIQLQVNDNKGNIGQLQITATEIKATVSKQGDSIAYLSIQSNQIQTSVQQLDGRVVTAESRITQNANQISAVVYNDGRIRAEMIIQAMNDQPSNIKLRADRIVFEGYSSGANADFNLMSVATLRGNEIYLGRYRLVISRIGGVDHVVGVPAY